MGVARKQSTLNFPKNEHFLPLIRTRTCAMIVDDFQTDCKKIRHIVNWRIAPYFQGILDKRIIESNSFFVLSVLCFYENLNNNPKIWDGHTNSVLEQKRQGGESEILGYKFSGHTTADIYGNFMEVAGKVNSYRLIQISIGGSRVNLKFMILVDSSRDENQLPWLVNIGSCYLDNVHHAFKTVADKSGKALKNYFTFVGFHESPDTREDVNHCWHYIFSINMLWHTMFRK